MSYPSIPITDKKEGGPRREQLMITPLSVRSGTSQALRDESKPMRFPSIPPAPSRHRIQRVMVIEEDPLDKIAKKAHVRNLSEFANKVILQHKQFVKPENVIEHTESTIYKSQKGATLDVFRTKRPLASRQKGSQAEKRICIGYEDHSMKTKKASQSLLENIPTQKDNTLQKSNSQIQLQPEKSTFKQKNEMILNLTLDQLNLLESIGTLTKCTSTYYPPKLEEVEYLVKTQCNSLFPFLLEAPRSKNPILISEEVRNFGMGAYRNNLHLTPREECIVLIDWLVQMKNKYTGENNGDLFEGFRNLEILLSFCCGEVIRMSKIECNERATVIQLIWDQIIKLLKITQQKMLEQEFEIKRFWQEKYLDLQHESQNIIEELRKQLLESKKSCDKLLSECKAKEEKISTVFLVSSSFSRVFVDNFWISGDIILDSKIFKHLIIY